MHKSALMFLILLSATFASANHYTEKIDLSAVKKHHEVRGSDGKLEYIVTALNGEKATPVKDGTAEFPGFGQAHGATPLFVNQEYGLLVVPGKDSSHQFTRIPKGLRLFLTVQIFSLHGHASRVYSLEIPDLDFT